ncbi:hypothetical protein MY04_0795 [Flammeovirga sp. MY04]|uniref:hypothetical protein n=1 Tax=Flammeovirga sp. MY04 TaxID=1191459 RepID=UPI0008063DB2|nr:hypothetical protein [Flammeovirga sp. MY04]ANQ48177.1 hypothetical protein MY04_0795 [Flammeovirga sp. MY04]
MVFIKILLINLLILITSLVYSQDTQYLKMELNEYTIPHDLKEKLLELTKHLRPEDKKLIFFFNESKKEGDIQYNVSGSYGIYQIDEHKIQGFFKVNDKLFLLSEVPSHLSLNINNKQAVKVELLKEQQVFDAYIDDLPYWILDYKDNKLRFTYTPYSMN